MIDDATLLARWNEKLDEIQDLKDRLACAEQEERDLAGEMRDRGISLPPDATPAYGGNDSFHSAWSALNHDFSMPASPDPNEYEPGVIYQSIEDPADYVQPEVAPRSPWSNGATSGSTSIWGSDSSSGGGSVKPKDEIDEDKENVAPCPPPSTAVKHELSAEAQELHHRDTKRRQIMPNSPLEDASKSLVSARLVYNRLVWLNDDPSSAEIQVTFEQWIMTPGLCLEDLLEVLSLNPDAPVQIYVHGTPASLQDVVYRFYSPRTHLGDVSIDMMDTPQDALVDGIELRFSFGARN